MNIDLSYVNNLCDAYEDYLAELVAKAIDDEFTRFAAAALEVHVAAKSRWPTKNGCPLCGNNAYVGSTEVKCCMEACANFG